MENTSLIGVVDALSTPAAPIAESIPIPRQTLPQKITEEESAIDKTFTTIQDGKSMLIEQEKSMKNIFDETHNLLNMMKEWRKTQ